MSRRSHRRRKKRGPKPVRMFSTRFFAKAMKAMREGRGFDYDGRTVTPVPRHSFDPPQVPDAEPDSVLIDMLVGALVGLTVGTIFAMILTWLLWVVIPRLPY